MLTSIQIKNGFQQSGENEGILNRVRLSWARRAEASLQPMAGILGNCFDVSFYAFTYNYNLFTLFLKPLLFSE
jgi:hypothetical protein